MSQITPVMHREPVELDARYISKTLRAAVFLKSHGHCADCGVKIHQGGFEADHITRWSDGGRTELDNLQALCLPCHAVKTRTKDTPGAAKTKRMAKAALPRDPDDIDPSRLRGRGFDQRLTKHMNGKVGPRKQRRNASQTRPDDACEGAHAPNHNKSPSRPRTEP